MVKTGIKVFSSKLQEEMKNTIDNTENIKVTRSEMDYITQKYFDSNI